MMGVSSSSRNSSWSSSMISDVRRAERHRDHVAVRRATRRSPGFISGTSREGAGTFGGTGGGVEPSFEILRRRDLDVVRREDEHVGAVSTSRRQRRRQASPSSAPTASMEPALGKCPLPSLSPVICATRSNRRAPPPAAPASPPAFVLPVARGLGRAANPHDRVDALSAFPQRFGSLKRPGNVF